MKVEIVNESVQITLTGQEAVILIEELSDVPGGSRLPKVKQLHDELRQALVWVAHGAGGYSNATVDVEVPPPPRRGRPPKKLQLVPTAPSPDADDASVLAFVRARLGPGSEKG